MVGGGGPLGDGALEKAEKRAGEEAGESCNLIFHSV